MDTAKIQSHLNLNASSLSLLREEVTAANADLRETVRDYVFPPQSFVTNTSRVEIDISSFYFDVVSDDEEPDSDGIVEIHIGDLVNSIDRLIPAHCQEIDDLVFSDCSVGVNDHGAYLQSTRNITIQ